MRGDLLRRLRGSPALVPKYTIGDGATAANPEVLEFYKSLPFNYHGSARAQADAVRARDWVREYPILLRLLRPGIRVLEIGCGVGWLSLSLALHHRADVVAIDFNPVVIQRAREIARLLRLEEHVAFEVADLFRFELTEPAELAVSIGVLHHTNDCHAALIRVFDSFVQPGGHVLIGLYHAHGRRPFLDHFAGMRAAGASEDTMFIEYRRLHPQLSEETFARSWFRDQVLHPHETQHTIAELLPLLDRCNMELCSTSINDYSAIRDPKDLVRVEKSFEMLGTLALSEGKYYPGFFVFLARKK